MNINVLLHTTYCRKRVHYNLQSPGHSEITLGLDTLCDNTKTAPRVRGILSNKPWRSLFSFFSAHELKREFFRNYHTNELAAIHKRTKFILSTAFFHTVTLKFPYADRQSETPFCVHRFLSTFLALWLSLPTRKTSFVPLAVTQSSVTKQPQKKK